MEFILPPFFRVNALELNTNHQPTHVTLPPTPTQQSTTRQPQSRGRTVSFVLPISQQQIQLEERNQTSVAQACLISLFTPPTYSPDESDPPPYADYEFYESVCPSQSANTPPPPYHSI